LLLEKTLDGLRPEGVRWSNSDLDAVLLICIPNRGDGMLVKLRKGSTDAFADFAGGGAEGEDDNDVEGIPWGLDSPLLRLGSHRRAVNVKADKVRTVDDVDDDLATIRLLERSIARGVREMREIALQEVGRLVGDGLV
jgi:hypothetical protein